MIYHMPFNAQRSVRPLLTLALGCGLFGPCASQSLDSLRALWEDPALPDTSRLLALNELTWEGYIYSDPDSAFLLAAKMRSTALSKGLYKYVAVSWDLDAAAHYVQGDFTGALASYDSSLTIYKANHDTSGMADVLTNMAGMRSYMGENELAMELYQRGYKMHLALRDSASIAVDLNSIGRMHMLRGDHARAVDLFAQSLRMHETLKDRRGLSISHNNLGALYMAQGDHGVALTHYAQALALAEELNDQHGIGKDLAEMGTCETELGSYAKARSNFERSLAVRESIIDQHGIINALNKLGDISRKEGDPGAALPLYRRSSALAKEIETPYGEASALIGLGEALLDLGRAAEVRPMLRIIRERASDAEDLWVEREAAELEYRCWKLLGRPAEALEAYERSIILRDSLMAEENQRELLRFEFAYAYETQALTDSLRHDLQQRTTILEHAAALAGERRDRDLLVLGIGFLLLLAVALWSRIRYVSRSKELILSAQRDLLLSERRREAEQVRARIASDIHDAIGSDLTKLRLLGKEFGRSELNGSERSHLTHRIVELAGDANASLGDLVWATDPHHDSAVGLVERCAAHVHKMMEDLPIRYTITAEHQGPDRPLRPDAKHDIFLLLKEALNNVVKHAGANELDVVIRTGQDQFELRLSDNGKGYDPLLNSHGNGSRTMRMRSARLTGNMEVATSPGNGCKLVIRGSLDRQT